MKPKKLKPKQIVIDDIIINELLFQTYLHKKSQKQIKLLTDLSQLNTRTESELLEVLNQMVKTKNFFKYCSSLLININPGPSFTQDYLNLQSWLETTSNVNESQWKPHLYSFMYYIYQTMINTKQNQVVNLLGPIGSGKTFNIIHIIEYFCCMVGPENHQVEIFDTIHKSIQLVHMMGSIYRENNIESTSCGMLLKLGFDERNAIADFDLDAKILDYTLPFSENGRSFSILHAFMTGAKTELKRKFGLPDKEISLNFFRKFSNNFTNKTKQRFKLNDLEIWNRFHSLLKYFNFSKEEVVNILSLLSFLLLSNELVIQKVKIGKLQNKDAYVINQGISTKKLAMNLMCNEDDFVLATGIFATADEAKSFIISLMKKAYYIVFDFILFKVRNYLQSYFINLARNSKRTIPSTKDTKYIYFLDFPGEVDDMTLGGFTTNIANECLNMYASSGYCQVIEQMLKNSVILKHFKPLRSYSVLKTAFGVGGLISNFNKEFNVEMFYEMKQMFKKNKHYRKCVCFEDDNRREFMPTSFIFDFLFSHKRVKYSYDTLYYEAKALNYMNNINAIFSMSQNSIVNFILNKSSPSLTAKSFSSYFLSNLQSLFTPIKSYKPFVIYCLHSNNSYKIFFNPKKVNKPNLTGTNQFSVDDDMSSEYDEIPNDVTLSIIKNSLAFPILNWDWYGYKEWMSIDDIVNEFCNDFERVKDKIIHAHNSDENKLQFKDIPFNSLDNKSKVNYTMNILSKENDYIIGNEYVIMKRGTLQRMRNYLNSMISTVEEYNKSKQIQNDNIPNKKEYTIHNEDEIYSRINLLKEQCICNIIESDGNVASKINVNNDKYSLFSIFDMFEKGNKSNYYKKLQEDCYDSGNSTVEVENELKKKNIVVPDFKTYSKIQNTFDMNKNQNYNIFDYNSFIPSIIFIQKNIRAMFIRKKVKYMEYLNYEIILIQKHVRRFLTKKKYDKFVDCLGKIIKIQNMYKNRFKDKIAKIILIQKVFRGYIKYTQIQEALNEKHLAEQKGEYWEFDNSYKIQSEIDERSSRFNNNNNNKNNNKVKRTVNRKKSSKQKQNLTKTQLLQEEKDPNKIIQMLLLDEDLLNDGNNDKLNAILLNTNIKNTISSKSKNKQKQKIEDKLLDYGKRKKQRETQEQLDKIKSEEEQFPFKPTISKNPKYNVDALFPGDFLKRMEYHKLFHERNLEGLRTHYVKEHSKKYTFKPQISSFANNLRRNFALLYNESKSKKRSVNNIYEPKQVYTTSFPINVNYNNNDTLNGQNVIMSKSDINSEKKSSERMKNTKESKLNVSKRLGKLIEEEKEKNKWENNDDVNDNNDNEEQGEDCYENNNKTDNYQIEDEENDIWPQRVDIVYAKEIE